MASNIKFKRSAVQNRVPTTAQLDLGELALNTYDGKLYTEINTGSAAVVEIGSKLSSLVVDGANGAGGGDVVFHGQTAGYDLTWDYSDNSLKFADNAKAKFGGANDLSIWHDSSHSYIADLGTGNLSISSSDGEVQLAFNDFAGNFEHMVQCNPHGSVNLFHNGSLRLTTTVDGVDIGGTGSLKLPVGTTAQRNSSPVAGDIRYNTTTGGFEGYSSSWGELGGGGIGIGSTAVNPASGLVTNRIGVGFTDINVVGTGISVTGYGSTIVLDFNDFKPGTFNRSIHNYTATAGQTTFAGLSYDNAERQIAVYLNGARLSEATYTATSGTTVVLDVGASVGDEVEIINININSDVDRNVNTYTATAGQTTFTGLSYNSITELDVYLNGIRLATGDFTATTGNTVVLNVGASVNDIVDIVSTGDGVSFRSTADTSGDKFTLTNVGIGTDQTPDKLNVRGNVNIVGVLTATTLHGDGSNLTNTGSTLSEPSSGTQRLVTTSLTTGTMTSSGTGSELTFDYSNNHLKFTDNTKVVFGTGTGDLEIYHSGTGSIINDIGVGHLHLRVGGSNRINIQPDNVQLCHSGNSKLETTSSGATVSGQLTAGTSGGQNPSQTSWATNSALNLFGSYGGGIAFNDNGNNGFVQYVESSGTIFNLKAGAVGAATEQVIRAVKDGTVELYHDGTKKFETTSTGASVTGNLAVSGVLTYDDVTNVDSVGIVTARSGVRVTADGNGTSNYISVGAGNDLKIFHNGTNSVIADVGTGNLSLQTNGADINLWNSADGEYLARFFPNGAVELYHDATKKFETTSSGAFITNNLEIEGTTVNDFESGRVRLTENAHGFLGGYIHYDGSANNMYIGVHPSNDTTVGNDVNAIRIVRDSNAAIHLNYAGSKRFETTSAGGTLTGNLTATGTFNSAAATFGTTSLDPDSNGGSSGGFGNIADGSGWNARGLFVHGGGTGQAATMGHNGTALFFAIGNGSSYDGLETWLRVTPGSRVINFTTDNNNTNVQIGGNKIFHAGNDGSGSGLDADTLDGQEGSYYRNASNLNAGTIPAARVPTLNQNTTGSAASLVLGNDSTGSTPRRIVFASADTGTVTIQADTVSGATYTPSTGTISAQIFNGSGSGLSNLNASNLSTGTVPQARLSASTLLTLIKTVDGSGSGLDADTLDGISSASFLRSDVNDASAPQRIEFSANNTYNYDTIADAAGNKGCIEIFNNGLGNDAFMAFHSGGDHAFYFGLDADTNKLAVGGWSLGANKYAIFHENNVPTFSQLGITASSINALGINATTLDNIDSSSFLRSDADDAVTNYNHNIRFYSNSAINSASGSQASLECFNASGSGNDAFMAFHVTGDFAAYFGLDGGTNDFAVGGWSMGAVSNKVWHAGNDGSGSGLDADTLDGVQAGGFLRADADDAWTGTLTNSSRNEVPSGLTGAIHLQPSVSGGNTGIYFNSKVNPNSDAGYIWWYDDNNNYRINDSTENGALVIGIQNDGNATSEDAIAIESSGNIFLNPGNDGGLGNAGGVTGPDFSEGKVYIGRAATKYEVFHGGAHAVPDADNTYDLGSSANRFRFIFTTDLQLSNENTGGNEVDGTEGNWTLQEGEDDIYMINRKNGKRYKIKMEEV